jgi:uncharacterized repeat protein (TIGR01451 family)
MGKRLSSPDRLLLLALGLGLGLALALLWTLDGGPVPTARAASFTVTRTDDPAPDGCNPGDCSLREAIIDANATPGADTISLGPGAHTLAIAGIDEDLATTGDLDITDDLTISGVNSATTIIDGGGLDRVFDVIAGNVTFSGVTIRNGAATEAGIDTGGGIRYQVENGTLNIVSSALSSNTSTDDGGAICVTEVATATRINITASDFISNISLDDDGGAFAHVAPTTTVTIVDSTFRGNRAGSSNDDGGALVFKQDPATITISNSHFIDNAAPQEGGALHTEADVYAIEIVGSTFQRNESLGGGAINFEGITVTAMIANSHFVSNTARGEGGALRMDNDGQILTISNSTFISNTVGSPINDGGGALCFEDRVTATVASSTFDRNTSAAAGGAIRAKGGSTVLTITECALISNSATTNGGAIQFDASYGTLAIANVTISDNDARLNGGGIAVGGNTATTIKLNNVTIANNAADANRDGTGDGGGLWITNILPDVVSIANSILANNTDAGNEAPDCFGAASITSYGHNLIGNGTGCGTTPATGDQIGTDATPIDPMLDALTGFPAYHPLLVDSPAINTANPAAAGSAFPACLAADQRGITRPQCRRCDIGAYEAVLKLSIGKGGPDRTTAGNPITYTLTITNDSEFTTTNLVITDAIPAGSNHVPSGGGTRVGDVVRWTLPSLAPGNYAQVQFVVTATEAITNSEYCVSCAEGASAMGAEAVVTNVGLWAVYLPLVARAY